MTIDYRPKSESYTNLLDALIDEIGNVKEEGDFLSGTWLEEDSPNFLPSVFGFLTKQWPELTEILRGPWPPNPSKINGLLQEAVSSGSRQGRLVPHLVEPINCSDEIMTFGDKCVGRVFAFLTGQFYDMKNAALTFDD
ncbi:MAG: hypothetical protein GDA41_06820 [Rhodospirillales bacterium]|nr:hypothetical protein [Rhodospirillales bacterium]